MSVDDNEIAGARHQSVTMPAHHFDDLGIVESSAMGEEN
jgi:hypothetical protein